MNLIDLHCDTLYKRINGDNDFFITDKYLKNGGYLAQCFAIYTPSDIKGEDALLYFKNAYREYLKMIKSSHIYKTIKPILTVENAEFLNGNIENIELIKKYNVKFLGLTHNGENCIGYPHSEKTNLPLKKFGKEVVEAINETDCFIDVSHLNLGGFLDVCDISKKPIIATHSACRDLVDNTRNLYDFQIKKIGSSGGIIGIPFYSKFLNDGNTTEIIDIINHLKHLIKIGGEEVAAIGSDFDGMECELFLKNAGEMQILTDAVIKEFGFSTAEKICYKNALGILN